MTPTETYNACLTRGLYISSEMRAKLKEACRTWDNERMTLNTLAEKYLKPFEDYYYTGRLSSLYSNLTPIKDLPSRRIMHGMNFGMGAKKLEETAADMMFKLPYPGVIDPFKSIRRFVYV